MTVEPLLELAAVKPFKTFWMALADGRVLQADGFDCLNFAPDTPIMTIYLPDSDETEIVDIRLIVSVRFSAATEAISS